MSTDWKPLPWQQELWLELTAQILQRRLAHALLLGGPRGVGKRHFAQSLVAFLLCETRSGYACGHCRSCEQLAAGTHPNLIHLKPGVDDKTGKSKRDISVEQIRDFGEKMHLTSHYGQAKLALIDPADALNDSGINALLKTIEEPPAGAHLLLISERPLALKPTLRSRCQRLRFAPPTREAALQWLQSQGVEDAAALEWAGGAPLRAAELQRDGWIERYTEWSRALRELAAKKRDPLAVAALVDKEQAAPFLAWLQQWLAQLLRQKLTGQDAFASGLSQAALEQMLRQTLEAPRRLAGNAAPQMLIESLMILWWRVARSAAA